MNMLFLHSCMLLMCGNACMMIVHLRLVIILFGNRDVLQTSLHFNFDNTLNFEMENGGKVFWEPSFESVYKFPLHDWNKFVYLDFLFLAPTLKWLNLLDLFYFTFMFNSILFLLSITLKTYHHPFLIGQSIFLLSF